MPMAIRASLLEPDAPAAGKCVNVDVAPADEDAPAGTCSPERLREKALGLVCSYGASTCSAEFWARSVLLLRGGEQQAL
jgi:hypothetical protein